MTTLATPPSAWLAASARLSAALPSSLPASLMSLRALAASFLPAWSSLFSVLARSFETSRRTRGRSLIFGIAASSGFWFGREVGGRVSAREEVAELDQLLGV